MYTINERNGAKVSPDRPARILAVNPPFIVLVAVAVAAFIAKVIMAYLTYGTNDITTFRLDARMISAHQVAELYRGGVTFLVDGKPWPIQVFSHPPFMIHMILVFQYLESITQLPLQFWMRLSCAIADLGTLMILAQSRLKLGVPSNPWVLLVIAGSPLSIMISGFHGNTDPIMVALLLASVFALESKANVRNAAILFGLAMSIKAIPIIFVAAILGRLNGVRQRLQFSALALAVVFVAGLPYTLTIPQLILTRIGSYSSIPSVASSIARALGIGGTVHKLFFGAIVIGVSAWMRSLKVGLLEQLGVIALLFLVLAPGFGIQYLALLPLAAATFGLAWIIAFCGTASLFAVSAYTHWAGGFPWYTANAGPLDLRSLVLLLGCWCLMLFMLIGHLDKLLKSRASRSDRLVKR